jgi:CDP-diacylglycerol--serine O-phosphatidyltransferase
MRHLPNFITLLNLFLGCIAIVCAMNGNLNAVPYLVAGAALADFADGFTARLLHVSSPMGLQLDSLADMVTFGVVPGVTMYRLKNSNYLGYRVLGMGYNEQYLSNNV